MEKILQHFSIPERSSMVKHHHFLSYSSLVLDVVTHYSRGYVSQRHDTNLAQWFYSRTSTLTQLEEVS